MTLDISALNSGLTTLFTAPPDSFLGCANQWAEAVYNYSFLVIPTSTTAAAAKEALAASLNSAFSTSVSAAVTATNMEAAFSAYATTLAIGMLPAYTGIPPAGSIGFVDIFEGEPPVDVTTAVTTFSSAISSWFLTGTATLVAPPYTVLTWV